jgi:WD40 repeat protein
MLLGGFILQNIDQPHQFSTCCATELADGRVATGAGGGPSTEETIKIWDLSTGECVRRLGYVGAESVSSLIQLQDHRYLASGQDLSTGDGSICIWDIDSGYRTHRINLDFGALEKLFSLNDGALGYLGLHPGDFYISRNRYYMEAVHGYDVPDDDADDTDVVSVCVLSDGATVACGLADGRIRLVDVSNNSKKNMDGTATNEKRSVGRSKFPITDCRNKKIVHYIDAPAATAATVEEGHDQHNESTEAFSDAPVQSRTSSPPLPVTSMCVLGDGKTLACVRSHTVRGVLELELELYDFQQVKDKIR